MEDKDLWTTFEKTGSVIDYLNYKGIQGVSEKNEIGESSVESRGQSDRDDTFRSSYRGI